MILSGISLVKNGNRLKYPWRQCFTSMSQYCDDMVFNIGASDDRTEIDARMLVNQLQPRATAIFRDWSEANTGDGSELAKQANECIHELVTPSVYSAERDYSYLYEHDRWVVYLQADEFLREREGLDLRQFLAHLPSQVSQVELFRTYFWGDLRHRAPQYELWLGRVFRLGTHTVGGDGMYLNRFSGEVVRYPGLIYHYSRMGAEEEVTSRLRTLDRLFHPEEEVRGYGQFSYNELTPTDLEEYDGPHPEFARLYYNSGR